VLPRFEVGESGRWRDHTAADTQSSASSGTLLGSLLDRINAHGGTCDHDSDVVGAGNAQSWLDGGRGRAPGSISRQGLSLAVAVHSTLGQCSPHGTFHSAEYIFVHGLSRPVLLRSGPFPSTASWTPDDTPSLYISEARQPSAQQSDIKRSLYVSAYLGMNNRYRLCHLPMRPALGVSIGTCVRMPTVARAHCLAA
jgi:hypothetical protein